MKLPLKHIVILVILSLSGIFAYQTYWLTSLYRTMKDNVEQNIMEAMRMSDYNEMMLRVEKLRKDSTDHGEVSVSAGFEKDGIESKAYVHSTTSIDRNGRKEQSTTRQVITHNATAVPDSGNVLFIEQRKGRNEAQWLNPDAAQKKLEAAVKDTGNSPKAALRAKGGLDMILRDQNSMLELATYFQRGLHSGLDVISDPDVHVYDSLLTLQLKERGITLPHRLEHIYTSDKSSPHIFVDTLAVVSTAGYVPGPEAKQYNYAFDLNTHQSYRLWMEPVTQLVLKQMWGILATSFVILIILSFSFWILIRTILRQKTLEEMKSDFTNNITHELKTPMTTIAGYTDGILDGTIPPENEKQYLRIIANESRRLSRLVRRMLDLSRLQSAENVTAQEQFDVSEVMLRVLVSLENKINARHLDVDTQLPDGPVLVWGDPDAITQVCYNLLDNAIKFSAEGSTMGLSITAKGGKAHVAVRNHGDTIPPDELAMIFDRFHKSDKSRSVDREGVGLGLYIVKTILNNHKENISVTSQDGVTEFVFTLTLA